MLSNWFYHNCFTPLDESSNILLIIVEDHKLGNQNTIDNITVNCYLVSFLNMNNTRILDVTAAAHYP